MDRKKSQGSAIGVITKEMLNEIDIPLPPLTIQAEIVAEIENFQKIIDGARQVVENYKPRIEIDPGWRMVRLNEVAEINRETVNPEKTFSDWFRYIDISSVENGTGVVNLENIVKVADAPSRARGSGPGPRPSPPVAPTDVRPRSRRSSWPACARPSRSGCYSRRTWAAADLPSYAVAAAGQFSACGGAGF